MGHGDELSRARVTYLDDSSSINVCVRRGRIPVVNVAPVCSSIAIGGEEEKASSKEIAEKKVTRLTLMPVSAL
jgi:hypothetical protein